MIKKIFFLGLFLFCSHLQAIVWNEPLAVGIDGLTGEEPASSINDNNQAVIAWVGSVASDYVIQTAIYSAGAWGFPVNCSPVGSTLCSPTVEINAVGDIMLAWQKYDGIQYTLEWSLYSSGTWSSPQTLVASDYLFENVSVKFNVSGDAILMWTNLPLGNQYVVHASSYTGGIWSTPQSLSSVDNNVVDAALALNDMGDAIIVWDSDDGALTSVKAVNRVEWGSWSVPTTISTANIYSFLPIVSIASSGDAIAVWESMEPTVSVIQAADFISGVWQAPATISAVGANTDSPNLSLNSHGNAIAVWRQLEGMNLESVACRKLNGSWQTPVVISQPGGNCRDQIVSLNDSEEAIVCWRIKEIKPTGYYEFNIQSIDFSLETWGTVVSTGLYSILREPHLILNNMGRAWGVCACMGYIMTSEANF